MTINVTDITPNVVTLRLTQFNDGFRTVMVTKGWA